MKLLNEPSRLMTSMAALVTSLFLFTVYAGAAIDREALYRNALDQVESAASAGDIVLLSASAYDAAMYAVDNDLTIQEACHQIAFVTITAAMSAGHSVESISQAAVDGVGKAAEELLKSAQEATGASDMPALELDAQACLMYGLRAAAELEEPEAFEPTARDVDAPDVTVETPLNDATDDTPVNTAAI